MLLLPDLLCLNIGTVVSTAITHFVEGCCDGMEDTMSINRHVPRSIEASNLRADDSQDKGTPRQLTAGIPSIIATSQSAGKTVATVSIAMTWSSGTMVGTCEDSNSNEGANEEEVEENPEPAKESWSTVLKKERHEHSKKGVQCSGSEDAFDRAEGMAWDTATSLDSIDEVVDFMDTD